MNDDYWNDKKTKNKERFPRTISLMPINILGRKYRNNWQLHSK